MQIMILKHTLTFLFIVLPLNIAGVLILPLVLPFIPKDAEKLPKYFRWFDNHEIYYAHMHKNIDGLAGSAKYRSQQGLTKDSSALKLFWVRYKWLALRNAINYFQYKYLGLNWLTDSAYYKLVAIEGDSEVNEDNPGRYFIVVQGPNGKKYFEYYRAIKIKYLPVVIRIRVGWKIGSPLENAKGETSQWVFIPFSIMGTEYIDK